jgi:hypothetical protein
MADGLDLIPAFEPQTNVYMDLTGVGDFTSVWHRHKNVNIRSDGAGGFTVSARQKYDADATNSKNDAAGSRGRGMYVWQGHDSVVVDEDKIYYNGGSTAMGTGNGVYDEYQASFVQYSQAGVDNLVVLNAGHTSTHASATHGEIWYSADVTGGFTRITDVDVPGENGVSLCRGGASLDGYLFVADINGNVYNSNLDDITSWAAADVKVAEREADIGIYLGRHKDHIYLLGSRSLEFWYDGAVSTNSPLLRREDLFYNIGCLTPNTVVDLQDKMYFLGQDADGNPEIYKLEEFKLTPIGGEYMKRNLSSLDLEPGPLTDLEPINYQVRMGYQYNPVAGGQLLLTAGNDTDGWATYVYTIATLSWQLADTNNDWTYKGGYTSTTNILPVVGTNYPLNNRVQFANGAVATFAAPVGNSGITDFAESTEADSYVYTLPWDANTDQRKRIKSLRLLAYRKADTAASYTTTNFTIAWEDTDAATAGGLTIADFQDEKNFNLNTTKNRIHRLGVSRQRVFKLKFEDCGVAYLKGLELAYDVLRG